MTKNGFRYAGALVILISAGACALPTGGGEPIRMAPSDTTYLINKNSEPAALTTFHIGLCNANAASCVNRVSVSDGCSKDPLKVKLDFDDLHVPKARKGRPLPIIWPLITPKWQYRANGISFYSARGEFDDKGNTGQGWVQINQAQQGGGFNYSISVVNTDTKEECTRDPIIDNDW